MKKAMDWLKKHKLPVALNLVLIILAGCCLGFCAKMKGTLEYTKAAEKWAGNSGERFAYISCFMPETARTDQQSVYSFKSTMEQKLTENSMEAEEGRTLWTYAYCGNAAIPVTTDKGSATVEALGVGGDFFFFHPLKLVSGGYFSGEDLMKDSVIIDEEAAWQLFGSSDIAGQSVLINNVPHFVEGVIKREDGKLAERAGLDKTIVYVSNETLNEYGTGRGISTYEVVAPNPVKGYVYNKVKEKIGVKEGDMVVVENSSRYSVEALVPVILDFGMRSMQHTAVRFPYWENMARGIEDISALVLLLQFILLLLPIVIVVSFLITKWRKRTFSWRDVERKVIDIKNRSIQYLQSIKNKTKSNEGGK